jgi:hypothetical protein
MRPKCAAPCRSFPPRNGRALPLDPWKYAIGRGRIEPLAAGRALDVRPGVRGEEQLQRLCIAADRFAESHNVDGSAPAGGLQHLQPRATPRADQPDGVVSRLRRHGEARLSRNAVAGATKRLPSFSHSRKKPAFTYITFCEWSVDVHNLSVWTPNGGQDRNGAAPAATAGAALTTILPCTTTFPAFRSVSYQLGALLERADLTEG